MKSRRSVLATVFVVLLGFLVGCGGGSGPVPVEIEGKAYDRIETGLTDLSNSGRGGLLRDLTGFAWDEVHVYFEGVSKKEIKRDAGGEVDVGGGSMSGSDRYFGAGVLFVFTRDGRPVRAFGIPFGGIASGGVWTSSARFLPGTPGVPGGLALSN